MAATQSVALVLCDAPQALEFSARNFQSTVPHSLHCLLGTHDEFVDRVLAWGSEPLAVPGLLYIAPEVGLADYLVNRKLFKGRSRGIYPEREHAPPHTPES